LTKTNTYCIEFDTQALVATWDDAVEFQRAYHDLLVEDNAPLEREREREGGRIVWKFPASLNHFEI